MKKLSTLIIVTITVFILGNNPSRGAVIVDNNTSGTFLTDFGLAMGDKAATGFTMGGVSHTLDSITMSLGVASATAATVSVSLNADDGGKPGAVIEDFGNFSMSGAVTQRVFNSTDTPTLVAGTKYYAVLNFNGVGAANPLWNAYSDIPNAGVGATLNGGAWHNTGTWTDLDSTASLDVVVSATPIPEPSATVLVFAAIGLVAGYCRRRSSK